jgi:type ISP restriction-modification system protein
MSQVLIQQYLNQLQDLRKVSGTHRESVVREAFKDLLKGWARSRDLIFVPEYEIATPAKERRYVDGALVHTLRVPFGCWEAKLMDLHFGYESVTPTNLKRVDLPDEKAEKAGLSPKCILKADKDVGRIIVDSETTLTGIPPEAWNYRLGNRSALEWILDQYKEKKPKDPTIREKFNTYCFANYKEKVIDLLMRVTTVSVRTVAIVGLMKVARR